jgi:glutamate--cysteine ligase
VTDDASCGPAGTSVAGRPAEHDPEPAILRDGAEAEAYVASVCFKHGPPRLLGAELEWLLERPAEPQSPIDARTLRAALGAHTPTTLDPTSPALPLPGGSTVTLEPGGQVELASPPLPDLAALLQTAQADAAVLHRMLSASGLQPQPRAAEPVRPPARILDIPRYRAMEQVFDRAGPFGRSAMSSTAAVQVCVDAGDGDADIARRWAAVHAVGPVLLAAFANSPRLHGRRTGWKSSRWACWMRADPARTAPPALEDVTAAHPGSAWARRVLHSPVLCVRADGGWYVPERMTFAEWIEGALPVPPTVSDLDYHISTLFPPVRPHGHLEVRYVDGQAGRRWALPIAVLATLLSHPDTTDMAREACEAAQGRWVAAARHGLADRVLARAAATLFSLACARVASLGAPGWVVEDLISMTEQQVLCGRCPADDPPGPTAPGPE